MKIFFELFGRQIPGYGLFISIGFIMVILYLNFQSYYKEMDSNLGIIGFMFALMGAGLGGKLLYWITSPESFLILFDSSIDLMQRITYAFTGGLVFLGGLIGAGLGILIFLKTFKELDFLKTMDVFAIGVPIFHMFGRMGCFMAGCCHGRPTDSFIGVIFPSSGLAPPGIKLFPTQLFGVIGNLFIVVLLIKLSKTNKHSGRLFSIYLILYSIGRFTLEFFRGDEIRGIYSSLSTSQWISLPLLMVGVIVFYISGKRKVDKNVAN